MFKRVIVCLIMPLLVMATCCVPSASAMTRAEKRAQFAERVKAGVRELGVGQDSVVRVRLRDRQRLIGYISAIGEESFAVTSRGGATATVPYPNVAQIQAQNLTTGAKVAIGVGIAVAAVVIAAAIVLTRRHNGCGIPIGPGEHCP